MVSHIATLYIYVHLDHTQTITFNLYWYGSYVGNCSDQTVLKRSLNYTTNILKLRYGNVFVCIVIVIVIVIVIKRIKACACILLIITIHFIES